MHVSPIKRYVYLFFASETAKSCCQIHAVRYLLQLIGGKHARKLFPIENALRDSDAMMDVKAKNVNG